MADDKTLPSLESHIASTMSGPKPKKGAPPVTSALPELTGFFGAKLAEPLGGVSRTGVSDTVMANLGRALPGVDRYGEAANNQTWYEQIGIKTANMLVNIPAGVLESAGYLYEIGEGAVTGKWDFNNGYIEALNEMKDPFGDILRKEPGAVFDMGDSAWWVQNMGGLVESVAQFYVPGVAIGKTLGGAAKLVSETAKLGATGIKIANAAAQGLTATSLSYIEGAMSGRDVYKSKYIAGYAKELETLTAQGIDLETAKGMADKKASELAGHAASTTVLTNVMLASALNYTSLGAIFKGHDDDILAFVRREATNAPPGETFTGFRQRMLATMGENKQLRKLLSPGIVGAHGVEEAAQEGLEEVINHFAEQSGLRDDGTSRSVWGAAFGQQNMGNFMNDAFTQEGALNFMLGALGGVGNTVVMENIPMKRGIVYDDQMNPIMETTAAGKNNGPDGVVFNPTEGQPGDTGEKKFKTKIYSPRALSSSMNKKYYAKAIEALTDDLQFIQETSNEMKAATLAGNTPKAEQMRMRLANIGNFNAIRQGLGTVWQNEYSKFGAADNKQTLEGTVEPQLEEANERVAQLEATFDAQSSTGNIDPIVAQQLKDARASQEKIQQEYNRLSQTTEAMEMGLAKDMNDNRYKDDAKKMVKDLQKWDNRYFQLKTKYDSIDEKGSEIAEAIFHREISLEQNRNILSEKRQQLAELERQRDPELTTSTSTRATLELGKHVARITMLDSDLKALDEATKTGNHATIEQLARKYSTFSSDTSADKAAQLRKTLGGLQERYKADFDQASNALDAGLEGLSTEFADWLDIQEQPEVSFDKMQEKFNQLYANNRAIDQEVLNGNMYLAQMEAEIAAHDLAHKQAISQGGIKNLIKWTKQSEKRAMDDIATEMERANDYNKRKEANQRAIEIVNERLTAKFRAQTEAKIAEGMEVLEALDREERSIRSGATINRILGITDTLLKELRNNRELVRIRIAELQKHLENIDTAVASAQASAIDEAVSDDENITPDNGTAETAVQVIESAVITEVAEEISLVEEHFPEVSETDIDVSNFDTTNIIIAEDVDGAPATIPVVTEITAMELFTAFHEGLITEPIISETVPTAEAGTTVESTGPVQVPFLLENELARLDEETRTEVERRVANALETKDLAIENMFMDLVRAGKMPKNLPGAIVVRIKDAIKESPVNDIPLSTVDEVTSSVNPEILPSDGQLTMPDNADRNDTSPDSEPDSIPTILFNPLPSYNAFLNSPLMVMFTGLKTVNVMSAAGLDQEFREVEVQYANGQKVYKKISMSEISKSDQAEKRMSPDFFKGGQTAVIIVDESYSGDQNIDDDLGNVLDPTTGNYVRAQKFVQFSDFLENGKIKMDDESISNFPIKIQDENGNQAGYVRRGGWVTAKNPGSIDYKNVADTYGPEGRQVTDNVDTQYERIMEMRRQIAQNFNAGVKTTYTVFEEKGPGQKIDNVREISKGRWAEKQAESCSKLLPDTSLVLGVVQHGNFKTTHEQIFDNNMLTRAAVLQMEEGFYGHGQVAALIPMANGQYDLALMNSHNLDRRDTNSVLRLIELALMPKDKVPSAEITAIREATGYDVRTYTGLKALLNEQFTYTQQIKDDHMMDGSRKPQFQIELIEQPSGAIEFKYGTAGKMLSAVTVNPRNLVDGKLPATTAAAISAGLATRLKSVQLTGKHMSNGLNNPGAYNTVHYFADKGWVKNVDNNGSAYKNFNEYVKSITETTTNGMNKNSAGKYVYAVHPHIPIRPGVVAAQTTVTTVQPLTSELDADPTTLPYEPAEDDFDPDEDYYNPMSNVETAVFTVNPSIGKIVDGTKLTLENLQRLYNFTPTENKNGKTPEAVLKELGERGISEIAPGHNPFYICG